MRCTQRLCTTGGRPLAKTTISGCGAGKKTQRANSELQQSLHKRGGGYVTPVASCWGTRAKLNTSRCVKQDRNPAQIPMAREEWNMSEVLRHCREMLKHQRNNIVRQVRSLRDTVSSHLRLANSFLSKIKQFFCLVLDWRLLTIRLGHQHLNASARCDVIVHLYAQVILDNSRKDGCPGTNEMKTFKKNTSACKFNAQMGNITVQKWHEICHIQIFKVNLNALKRLMDNSLIGSWKWWLLVHISGQDHVVLKRLKANGMLQYITSLPQGEIRVKGRWPLTQRQD